MNTLASWNFTFDNAYDGEGNFINLGDLPVRLLSSFRIKSDSDLHFYIPNVTNFLSKGVSEHKILLQKLPATDATPEEGFANVIDLLVWSRLKAKSIVNNINYQSNKNRQHKLAETFLRRHYTEGLLENKQKEGKLLASFSQEAGVVKLKSATSVFRLTAERKSYTDELEEILGCFENAYGNIMKIVDNLLANADELSGSSSLPIASNFSQYDKAAWSILLASFYMRMEAEARHPAVHSKEELSDKLLMEIVGAALPMSKMKWTFLYCSDAYVFPFMENPLLTVKMHTSTEPKESPNTTYYFPLTPQLLLILHDGKLPIPIDISLGGKNFDFAKISDNLLTFNLHEIYMAQLINLNENPLLLGMALARSYLDHCYDRVKEGKKAIYWNPKMAPFGSYLRKNFCNQPSVRSRDAASIELEKCLLTPTIENEVWLDVYRPISPPFPSNLYVMLPEGAISADNWRKYNLLIS